MGYSLRLFITVLMTFVLKIRNVHIVAQQSHLCERRDLPCHPDDEAHCHMKYYRRNSTECKDLVFNEGATTDDDNLGKVLLEPYHFTLKTYRQTGFNVTMSDINWRDLKFRFKQEGNEMKNSCREFHMLSNSTIKNLFYDCLWSRESYEGQIFNFEYEASKNGVVTYKKYIFRVPFESNINEKTTLKNWEIFLMIECEKNAFGLTTFTLHWLPIPERFGVNDYSLKVVSTSHGYDEILHVSNITCQTLDDCRFTYSKWYGNVQFVIQPICNEKSGCYVSKSGVFHLVMEDTRALLIAFIASTILFPLALYLFFLIKGYIKRRSKHIILNVPKMLVVYNPSLTVHVEVVFALVDYMKKYCNVEPLVDKLHIFHSKSRDPFKWCNDSFKTADIIMIIASPYHNTLRLADSVYKNTDKLMLRLLKQGLSTKNDRTRFFVLMLPYCTEKDIPSEAVNLRRFNFPNDLNKMLRFIHKVKRFSSCLTSELPGGKGTYRLLGGKVKEEIAEAQDHLIEHKVEYDQMVEEIEYKRETEEGMMENVGETEENENERKPLGRRQKKKKELNDMFSEYPGNIDDLNLSGRDNDEEDEEEQRLMLNTDDSKTDPGGDFVRLDDLNL